MVANEWLAVAPADHRAHGYLLDIHRFRVLLIVRGPALGLADFTSIRPAEHGSVLEDAARQRSRAAGQVTEPRITIEDGFFFFNLASRSV